MPGLAMWWPFTPAPPTSPYAPGSNASGVAAVASQPRQQTRRRQCPWPWQVQCPRPAALSLDRACQRPRPRLPPASYRRLQPCQRVWEVRRYTGALVAADCASPPSRLLMSPARLAPLLAPQLSPMAGELFSCCVGAGVVGRVHPRFVTITHRHRTAPPLQCDLSRRTHCCCRYRHCRRHCHCGHYH